MVAAAVSKAGVGGAIHSDLRRWVLPTNLFHADADGSARCKHLTRRSSNSPSFDDDDFVLAVGSYAMMGLADSVGPTRLWGRSRCPPDAGLRTVDQG